MALRTKKNIFFLLLICIAQLAFAQNAYIDSLKKILTSVTNDTTRLSILDSLWYAYAWSKPDTSLSYAQQQLLEAKKIKSPKWEARALTNYGYCQYIMGNFPLAIDNEFQALKIAEKIKEESR